MRRVTGSGGPAGLEQAVLAVTRAVSAARTAGARWGISGVWRRSSQSRPVAVAKSNSPLSPSHRLAALPGGDGVGPATIARESRAASWRSSGPRAAASLSRNGRGPLRNAVIDPQQCPWPSTAAARSSCRQDPGKSRFCQPGFCVARGDSVVTSATWFLDWARSRKRDASVSACLFQHALTAASQSSRSLAAKDTGIITAGS
jgi:hypothetical protein